VDLEELVTVVVVVLVDIGHQFLEKALEETLLQNHFYQFLLDLTMLLR
jgi:hypothetical protein